MIRVPVLTRALIGAGAAALALGTTLPAAAQDEGDVEAKADVAAPASKGEQRLAKLLEGREPGKPVSCISRFGSNQVQTIAGVAYVYGRGNTIYVQRTRNPDQIDDDDALIVTRTNGSQLCRLDQTTKVDRLTGIFSGAVFFEDFVPYTRVKGASKEG